MSPLYVRKVLTRLTFLNQNTPRLGCFPAAWLQGLFYNVRLQGEPLRRFHPGWDRLGKADSMISTGIKLRFGQNGDLDHWFCSVVCVLCFHRHPRGPWSTRDTFLPPGSLSFRETGRHVHMGSDGTAPVPLDTVLGVEARGPRVLPMP